MQDGYVLRSATEDDAALIARHRGLMFLDMKTISKEQAEALTQAAKPWILRLLRNGAYRGWFLEYGGDAVAGGGLHIRLLGPTPACLRVGLSAHIANVYTVPAHRRRGLARHLMQEMLTWYSKAAIDHVTLTPSHAARNLYAGLGFEATGEMKLSFPGTGPTTGDSRAG